MQDTAKVIRIFVGGPKDANEAGLATINLIRNQIQTELGDRFSIIVNNWKDDHNRFGLSVDDPQSSIDKRFDVKRADIVLMLFRKSLGEANVEDSPAPSASAWELEEAAIAGRARAIGILLLRFDNPRPLPPDDDSPAVQDRYDAERTEWRRKHTHLEVLRAHISAFCTRWKKQGRNIYMFDDVRTNAEGAAANFVREILNVEKPVATDKSARPEPNLNFDGAPYCGLYEFTFDHRDVYFGRSAEIAELHAKCAGPDGARLLIVHGASGVGKSSLIQAGLLPTFATADPTGTAPKHLLFDPAGGSRRPFLELAGAVKAVTGSSIKANQFELSDDFQKLFSNLREGDDLISRRINAARDFERRLRERLTLPASQSVVPVLINQFENVYYAEQDEREAFFNFIACAPHFRDLRVIASMRQDAYDKMVREEPHVNAALGEGQRGSYTLRPPSLRQLGDMIFEPWRLIYGDPPTGFLDLAEEVLRDALKAGEAALPLVSQTLFVLHNDYKSDLRLENYLNIGRLMGVIKNVTEKQRIDPVYLKSLFQPLSTLRDGRWTTQTTRISALVAAGVPSTVIEQLAGDKVRLLYIGTEPDGEPNVRLAHEILFTAWPALAAYADEARLHESERVNVIVDARNWKDNGSRSRDLKLRGESYHSIVSRIKLNPELFSGKYREIVDLYIQLAHEIDLRERLINAANAGFLGEVVDLLREGARLDFQARQQNSSGLRPQFWAAITGNDYETPDARSWDRSPRLAPPEQSLFIKSPKLAHSTVARGMSVAHIAATCGHLDLLKRLMEVDPHLANLKSEHGGNLVDCAALGGDLATVKYLIEDLKLPFDEEDDEKGRPIIWAVQKNNRAVIGYLEKLGVRVGVTTQEGFNTLTEAARSGDIRGVEDALKDDRVKIDNQTTDGQTALMIAAAAGHAAVVRMLLDRGAKVALKTKYGSTALHMIALQTQQTPEIIDLLINKGADRNATDNEMDTPLHWAASSGKGLIVRTLLGHNVERDLPNSSGFTPLLAAANLGHAEVVRELLRAEVDLGKAEKLGWTALHFVADDGDQTTLHELLLFQQITTILDRRSVDGWTPLLLAARKGHVECLTRLIEAGADLRIKLPNGPDALALAIKSLSLAAVNVILAAAASYDEQ